MALAHNSLADTPTAPTLQEMVDEPEVAEDGEDDALLFDTSPQFPFPPYRCARAIS